MILMGGNLFFVFAADKNPSSNTDTSSARLSSFSLKKHSLGIGIGETFLSGDMSDYGENSITADIFYSYAASRSFDAVANAHYSKHSHKDQFVRLSGITFGIKSKLFQFDSFSPFVMAGLGFYRPVVRRIQDGSLKESEAKTAFGWNVGAGADLKLNSEFTVGVLSAFHNPFDVQQENGADVEGAYFKLLMTSMYTF
jgi:opacity protein-like surface antigen